VRPDLPASRATRERQPRTRTPVLSRRRPRRSRRATTALAYARSRGPHDRSATRPDQRRSISLGPGSLGLPRREGEPFWLEAHGRVVPAVYELRASIGEFGRGERSHTDRSDLNVPLGLSCELVGRGRWYEMADEWGLDVGIGPTLWSAFPKSRETSPAPKRDAPADDEYPSCPWTLVGCQRRIAGRRDGFEDDKAGRVTEATSGSPSPSPIPTNPPLRPRDGRMGP
jgi:hypothetical protein